MNHKKVRFQSKITNFLLETSRNIAAEIQSVNSVVYIHIHLFFMGEGDFFQLAKKQTSQVPHLTLSSGLRSVSSRAPMGDLDAVSLLAPSYIDVPPVLQIP